MASPRRYGELDGRTFLICIGAMKAATSWLHARLRVTPGAAVSPLKEVRFFDARFPAQALIDSDLLAMDRLAFHVRQQGDPAENLRRRPAFRASLDRARMIYDEDAYFGHFAGLVRPDTRVLADITPAYAVIGRDGFADMKRFCESQDMDLKILFILRDPVDRLWSHLRFLPQLDADADPLRDWPARLRDPATLARSDYRRTIEDLEQVFEPGRIDYRFYETLFDVGYEALCAGLGLTPGPPVARNNETRLKADLPAGAAQAFREALAPQYAFCAERFGAALPEAWRVRDRPL